MLQRDREWIEAQFEKVNERLTEVRIEIAKLKVKAGFWGALGALVVTIGAILLRRI